MPYIECFFPGFLLCPTSLVVFFLKVKTAHEVRNVGGFCEQKLFRVATSFEIKS